MRMQWTRPALTNFHLIALAIFVASFLVSSNSALYSGQSIGPSHLLTGPVIGYASAQPQTAGTLSASIPDTSSGTNRSALAPFFDKPLSAAANLIEPQSVKINEVELNPAGNSSAWIELYNPTPNPVSLSNYLVRTLNNSTISFPSGTVIIPGGFFVLQIQRSQISNIADMLYLYNSSGAVVSRTPLLIDRFHDNRTWQRVPDGSSEWRFLNQTEGSTNDPSTFTTPGNNTTTRTSPGSSQNSTASCVGSAGCAVGTIIRIGGSNILYLQLNSTIYKVQLALISGSPVTNAIDRQSSAVSLSESYCLGNTALVNQDDGNPSVGDGIVAAVYCSGISLNQQLLQAGVVNLDKSQCSTSEFASTDWAKSFGC